MSQRHIPPLPSLRAFEAAARLGSFTAAAQELNVTQSAVSQAVRQLEEHLGRKLFSRTAGSIHLTAEARQLASDLSTVLNNLVEALNAVFVETTPVRIACARSLLLNWLLPRLREFNVLHPDIPLQLLGTDRGASDPSADVNLISAPLAAPPPDSKLLCENRLVLVAAPDLAERYRQQHNSLEGIPRVDTFGADWSKWQSELPLAEASGSRVVLRLREATAIIRAALEGLGVALVSEFLAADEIKGGRLVLLSERRLAGDQGFWLQSRIKTPGGNASKLIAWLNSKATPVL
jgi:LysR family glycine cleavage system transcriptional activator